MMREYFLEISSSRLTRVAQTRYPRFTSQTLGKGFQLESLDRKLDRKLENVRE